MLRAIRFAAELGFERRRTSCRMRKLGRLAPPVISVERVSDELRKMLVHLARDEPCGSRRGRAPRGDPAEIVASKECRAIALTTCSGTQC
jgi:hypothetical protein